MSEWIPLIASLTTGLITLSGVWITQKSQKDRVYKSYLIEKKLESLLELQLSLHNLVEKLNKCSILNPHNNLCLMLMRRKTDYLEMANDNEKVFLKEFLTNFKLLKEAEERLYNAYFMSSIHFDRQEERALDTTIFGLISLSNNLVIKFKAAYYLRNNGDDLFIDQLQQKMEAVGLHPDKKIPVTYEVIKNKILSMKAIT